MVSGHTLTEHLPCSTGVSVCARVCVCTSLLGSRAGVKIGQTCSMCRWHTHTHPPPDLGSFTSGGRQTGSGIRGCVREDQGAGLNLGREGVVKGDIISVMSIISCPSSLCTCRDFSAGIHLFFKNWPSTPIPCGVQKAAYVASKTVIESFRTLVMKDEMMFFNLWSPSEHSFFFFLQKGFPSFFMECGTYRIYFPPHQ